MGVLTFRGSPVKTFVLKPAQLVKLYGVVSLLNACQQLPTKIDTSTHAESRDSEDVQKAPLEYGGSSPDENYRNVLTALKLTDDSSSPSDLVSDEDYRNKLKDEFIREIGQISCHSIHVQDGSGIEQKTGISSYLVQYKLAKYNQSFHAIITTPSADGMYPLMIYSSSGFEIPYQGAELKSLVGTHINKLVTATPMLGDEPFIFNGKLYQDAPAGEAYLGEVDRTYGLALCLQNNHDALLLDGRSLSSLLQLSQNNFPGYRTIASGSGRGGLVASLAMARSGAALLGSITDTTQWVRYDCGVLANPLHTFYGAEARLTLAALVRGNTEETKYPRIPGFRQLRYEIFHNYRNKVLTADDVAFHIAKRDAFITSPFVNMALKDFSVEPDEKGVRAGGLLVMHGTSRNDFTVNSSRIYANVASTVNFIAAENTNGTNILYREFVEANTDEKQSFKNIFSDSFHLALGKTIADFNVFVTDDLKGKEKNYNWVIRGSAYANSLNKTPTETAAQFLSASCGLN